MESHAQSVEAYLIDGLSFKLTPGASYITQRRSVTFFPTGGNSYSPTGVKVVKVHLNGNGWLDPSTQIWLYPSNLRCTEAVKNRIRSMVFFPQNENHTRWPSR